tara:strand:+ start:193 stop:1953 length:1761 start_codon:yes stop_codon:yes gene_type:complete
MAIPENLKFQEIIAGIKHFYSGSESYQDPIMGNMSNITGYCASLPPNFFQNTNVLHADNLGPFYYNADGTAYANSDAPCRYMRVDEHSLGDINNMFFCAFSGNYTVRTWNNNTSVYKNGSLVSTPASAGDTVSMAALIVGDRIEFSKPCSFYFNNVEGLTGAYGGYAGYCFGFRNDRQSAAADLNKIQMFVIDNSVGQGPGDNGIELGYTTTDDSNVTSISLQFNEAWEQTYQNYGDDLSITRNYVAQSSRLMCCWRGRATAEAIYDAFPIYPMTTEPKYGWYSQGGHILAAAGPYQKRDGSSTGYQVQTRTNTTTTNEFTATTNVAEWFRGDKNTGANSSAYFAGTPAVTFIEGGVDGSTGAGPIFAAESQGDGNGTEMTSHVGEAAMAKFTVIPASADWAAFIATISTGKGVVMRFNSSNTWQETKQINSFANTSAYKFVCTRFTSTSANDSFWATVPVQGYSDVNSSQDDESNLIMGDDTDFFNASARTLTFDSSVSGGGMEEQEQACGEQQEPETMTVYKPQTGNPSVGHVYFSDAAMTVPIETINGGDVGNFYYKITNGRSNFAVRFASPSCGMIDEVDAC